MKIKFKADKNMVRCTVKLTTSHTIDGRVYPGMATHSFCVKPEKCGQWLSDLMDAQHQARMYRSSGKKIMTRQ